MRNQNSVNRAHRTGGPAYAAMVLVLVFAIGCETTHEFKVDAIRNPEVDISHGKSYRIITTDVKIDEEDPQFQEVAEYVKTVLSSKGYYEAADMDSADLVIDVSYGAGNTHVEYDVRISGPEPRSSGVLNTRNPYGQNVRIVTPQEEYVPKTIFEKYLKITARENQPVGDDDKEVQAWNVTVRNQDENPDLDKYLPLMAAAAVTYVGEETESQEKVTLKEGDDKVRFIKKGM